MKERLSVGSKIRARASRGLISSSKLQTAVFASYFLFLYGLLLYRGFWVTPDQILILFSVILCFVMRGRANELLRDWIPFVFLILAYQALRGTALAFGFPIHETDIIELERWLFGTVPTVSLQRLLHEPGIWRWYDSVALFFYLSHFILPFSFALALRIYDRPAFIRFSTALVVLSFLGFFTYIVFPLVPPWMASQRGSLEPIERIMWPGFIKYFPASVLHFFNPNDVAAMPSLHAAWPTLVWLSAQRLWGRWGFPLVLWPIAVSFVLVYSGEHYVVDILAGVIYALAVDAFVARVMARREEALVGSKKTTGSSLGRLGPGGSQEA
jgi:membrane-associated phospholipid phosphatase